MKNFFSVPADFKTETLNQLAELNQKYSSSQIIECYGQITDSRIRASGRNINTLPLINLKNLEKYIAYSRQVGINFNYTLNPSCMANWEFTAEGTAALKSFLKDLHSIGVTDLTLAMPPLFELVQSLPVTFNIKASAICEINTPYRAQFYQNAGAKRLVLDPDIYKNFHMLRNVVSVIADDAEVIVNNVCRRHCPYKRFHYDHDSHTADNDKAIGDYYTNRCSIQKSSDIATPFKLNWIRPEDIGAYNAISIHHFKIQGRQNVINGDLIRTAEAYMTGYFQGNLFDLITLFNPYNAFQVFIDNKKLNGFLSPFEHGDLHCHDLCNECGYCDRFARTVLDIEDADKKNHQCQAFFKQYDLYNGSLRENREFSSSVQQNFNWGNGND